MAFTFISSKPDIMQPKEELIKFQPGELKEIRLVLSPQAKAMDLEVMMHINSQNAEGDPQELSHTESMLLKIQIGKK